MKKQKTKHSSTESEKPGKASAELETTIADLGSATSDALKKHKTKVIVVVAAVIVGFGIAGTTKALRESHIESVQAEFFRLFTHPVERNEEPDSPSVTTFLQDLHGDIAEPFMVKEFVKYKLSRAGKLESEASGTETSSETPEAGGAESGGAQVQALREEAVALAKDLAARYPDAQDLQRWKDGLQRHVEAAGKTPAEPAPLEFRAPEVTSP